MRYMGVCPGHLLFARTARYQNSNSISNYREIPTRKPRSRVESCAPAEHVFVPLSHWAISILPAFRTASIVIGIPFVFRISARAGFVAAFVHFGWRPATAMATIYASPAILRLHPPLCARWPLACRDPRVLIGWSLPLGFGLDGRLLLARRGWVCV